MSRILRLPEVLQRVGLSRSSVYKRISEGSFPRSIPLGAKSVGFVESEVEAWIEKRIKERHSAN